MDCTHYRPGKLFHFLYARDPKRFAWVGAIDPEWYSFEYFCTEAELLARIHLVTDTVFHILYGENQFRFLGHTPVRRGNRVVATFHQPPDVLPRAIPRTARIARADAIVVVGSSQLDYFRRLTGRDNVHLVPHGVDTDFFTPGEAGPEREEIHCVSVGWWLRDVETIRRVIATTGQLNRPRIVYHIVTFPWCHEYYRGLPHVHLYSGIPDEELRALYRRCDLLLLPLNDCTANNAVLEASACGLPVFTSAAGSIQDYVTDANAVIVPPKDADCLIDALVAAAGDRPRLRVMGRAARLRAEQFAWPRVAGQMRAAYARILG
jgi:glycosyltransferase involved in cell wall biosynthesis